MVFNRKIIFCILVYLLCNTLFAKDYVLFINDTDHEQIEETLKEIKFFLEDAGLHDVEILVRDPSSMQPTRENSLTKGDRVLGLIYHAHTTDSQKVIAHNERISRASDLVDRLFRILELDLPYFVENNLFIHLYACHLGGECKSGKNFQDRFAQDFIKKASQKKLTLRNFWVSAFKYFTRDSVHSQRILEELEESIPPGQNFTLPLFYIYKYALTNDEAPKRFDNSRVLQFFSWHG